MIVWRRRRLCPDPRKTLPAQFQHFIHFFLCRTVHRVPGPAWLLVTIWVPRGSSQNFPSLVQKCPFPFWERWCLGESQGVNATSVLQSPRCVAAQGWPAQHPVSSAAETGACTASLLRCGLQRQLHRDLTGAEVLFQVTPCAVVLVFLAFNLRACP